LYGVSSVTSFAEYDAEMYAILSRAIDGASASVSAVPQPMIAGGLLPLVYSSYALLACGTSYE